jgi:hypothetical protein
MDKWINISMHSCLPQYMDISCEGTARFISREGTPVSIGPVVVSTDLEWRRRRRYLPLTKADMWCSVTYQFKSNEYKYNTDLHFNLNRSDTLASLNIILFALIVVILLEISIEGN